MIVTLCGTAVAALKFASPGWVAFIVQVPPVMIVTVVPVTEQTAAVAETYVIGSSDDDVATGAMANVPEATNGLDGVACAAKVIV